MRYLHGQLTRRCHGRTAYVVQHAYARRVWRMRHTLLFPRLALPIGAVRDKGV